jgi:hypothetical protein
LCLYREFQEKRKKRMSEEKTANSAAVAGKGPESQGSASSQGGDQQRELWSVTEAADRLGISRRTFYRYIKKYERRSDSPLLKTEAGIKLDENGLAFFRDAIAGRTETRGRRPKHRSRHEAPQAPYPVAEGAGAGSSQPSEESALTESAQQEPRLQERQKSAGWKDGGGGLSLIKEHLATLQAQVEDLRQERNRIIEALDESRNAARKLQEERDKLLFEVAEWRGLYGRVEDQRALVVQSKTASEGGWFQKVIGFFKG